MYLLPGDCAAITPVGSARTPPAPLYGGSAEWLIEDAPTGMRIRPSANARFFLIYSILCSCLLVFYQQNIKNDLGVSLNE